MLEVRAKSVNIIPLVLANAPSPKFEHRIVNWLVTRFFTSLWANGLSIGQETYQVYLHSIISDYGALPKV